ncbi:MAG: hypothetical protein WAV00_23320 [Nocardioides sp.]
MDSGGYVVGWGTLSLINAGLAQGKGRSGLGWWLVSLLLGPIATLLIVLLPDIRRVPTAVTAHSDSNDAWIGRPLTADEGSG